LSANKKTFTALVVGFILVVFIGVIIAAEYFRPPLGSPAVQTAQASTGWGAHVDAVEDGGSMLYWSNNQPASQAEHHWVYVYLTVTNNTGRADTFNHWRVSLGDGNRREWYASGRGDALAFSKFRGLSSPDEWLIEGETARYIIVFDGDIDITTVRVFVNGREVR
jgi:hypothetical protein